MHPVLDGQLRVEKISIEWSGNVEEKKTTLVWGPPLPKRMISLIYPGSCNKGICVTRARVHVSICFGRGQLGFDDSDAGVAFLQANLLIQPGVDQRISFIPVCQEYARVIWFNSSTSID